MIEQLPLNPYQIQTRVRRFWRLYAQQQHRGKNTIESDRIAHQKLAPELRPLSDRNRAAVINAIELSR